MAQRSSFGGEVKAQMDDAASSRDAKADHNNDDGGSGRGVQGDDRRCADYNAAKKARLGDSGVGGSQEADVSKGLASSGQSGHEARSPQVDSRREPVRISATDMRREDFSVCTYNLLHPDYAVKWKLAEGISTLGESNWSERAHVLGRILQESKMDVCFLQEVGESMVEDLRPYLVEYEQELAVHPGRRAKDGVAVLVRRQRLQVSGREVIKIAGKGDAPDGDTGSNHMSALAISALDKLSGARVLLTSVHFYSDWFHDPQETVLGYIEGLKDTVDLVVWGGDCNTEYTSPPCGYVGAAETYPTRGHLKKRKTIDWIFASQGTELLRSDATEAFVLSTKQTLEGTGLPPSDHFGEAVVVRQLPRVAAGSGACAESSSNNFRSSPSSWSMSRARD